MKIRLTILRPIVLSVVVGSAGFILGCEKALSPVPSVSTAPTTQPITSVVSNDAATQASAELPDATTQPSGSSVMVDRRQEWFGPAMLRLTESDGKVSARLYSDNPKGVLTGTATANSYDFDMELPDITSSADIAKAVWHYKSPSSDRQDSPYGIFLNTEQRLLQPMDVEVQFQGQAPNVKVGIVGTFWMYRTTDEVPAPPPVMVRVMGVVNATVPAK